MNKTRLVLMVSLLASCALGPNFHHPAPPPVTRYTEKPMPRATVSAKTLAGNTQYLKIGQEISLKWWTVFKSPALNQLIKDSIQGNPDIEAASASLKIAHENMLVQKTALLPLVTGNYNPSRQLTAGTLASNVMSNAFLYTLNTTSLSISYMPDVLGFTRRTIESARAQEEIAFFQREAVYLTLTSNVVLAAIQEAFLRAQIQITRRMIHLAKTFLHTMQQQKSFGAISESSVLAQAAYLAQIEAQLPPLQMLLAQQHDLIASLRGSFPSESRPQKFVLTDFTLPAVLPVKLPAQLVAQRPDVRAAEAQMHVASAQIGVAIANRFPNIVLSGNGGFIPVDFNINSIPATLPILPSGSTFFWGIAGNLAGTIFDAGSLLHQQRAAQAAYRLAVMQYKRVVLNAFQNVADALKAIQYDAKTLKLAVAQEQASKKSWIIVKQNLKLGRASYLDVLNAEKTYQLALATVLQNQANRFNDTVALFQALGGGWRCYDVSSSKSEM